MIYAMYFSPTGSSKKNAIEVAKIFDNEFISLDLTVLNAIKLPTFTKDDLVIFSCPVYMGRIYTGVFKALEKIQGHGASCMGLATYGNRHYDEALNELCTFAKSKDFRPISAAALIGQHTYGTIATGRPNEEDLNQTRNFFTKVKRDFLKGDMKELSSLTTFQSTEACWGGRFRPLTSDQCTACGLCSRECPTQAISYDNYKDIDDEKCIACFRCIKVCPVHAKNMNTSKYEEFAEAFTLKLAKERENQYFKS